MQDLRYLNAMDLKILKDSLLELKNTNVGLLSINNITGNSYFNDLLMSLLMQQRPLEVLKAIVEEDMAFDINPNNKLQELYALGALNTINKQHDQIIKILATNFHVTAASEIQPGQTIAHKFLQSASSLRLTKTLKNLLELDLMPVDQAAQEMPSLPLNIAQELANKIANAGQLKNVVELLKEKCDLNELASLVLSYGTVPIDLTLKAFSDVDIKVDFNTQNHNGVTALQVLADKNLWHQDLGRVLEVMKEHTVDWQQSFNGGVHHGRSFITSIFARWQHMPWGQMLPSSEVFPFIEVFAQSKISFAQKDTQNNSALSFISDKISSADMKYFVQSMATSGTKFIDVFITLKDKVKITDLLSAYKDQEIDFNSKSQELTGALSNNPMLQANAAAVMAVRVEATSLLAAIFTQVNDQLALKKVMTILKDRQDIDWSQELYGVGGNNILSKIAYFENLQNVDIAKLLTTAKEVYNLTTIKLNSIALINEVVERINLDHTPQSVVSKIVELGFEIDKGLTVLVFADKKNVPLSISADLILGAQLEDISVTDLPIIARIITRDNNYWSMQANFNKLVSLGFQQWDGNFGNGHNFFMKVLDNCVDFQQIKFVLNICSSAKDSKAKAINFDFAHKNAFNQDALDLMVMKAHGSDVTELMQPLSKFSSIDWSEVASKFLNAGIIDLNNFINMLPGNVDLLKVVQGKALIESLLNRVQTFNEFEELMLICKNKFNTDLNAKIGANENHILTYLPRHLLDIANMLQSAGKLAINVDWQSNNKEGTSLLAKIIQKADSAFIKQNIEYLMANVQGFNWQTTLDEQQNNLLLLIAQGNEIQRWEFVKDLITKTDGNGMPLFNVNHKNHPGERLIDKAKYLLDVNAQDNSQQAVDLVRAMEAMIRLLRDQGSVEPVDGVITDNLRLDKDRIESTQNYQALPKLRTKLHAKYNLDQHIINQQVNDLKVQMEAYIVENWQSEEERKLMRDGDGMPNESEGRTVTGLITETNRLTNLSQQNKQNQSINLQWDPKIELAYLWVCAKENGLEKKFFEVFSGLSMCEWGRLVNLYAPLAAAIMGHNNDLVAYSQMIKEISPIVQQVAIVKLQSKFADKEKVKQVIVDAFVDFMECRGDLGEIMPEQWKMETQTVIGTFNQVFTANLSKILNKEIKGLTESYHYREFIQLVVTALISEPEQYAGDMTNIFINEKVTIAETLLNTLVQSHVVDLVKVIVEFQQKHGTMLDLRVFSKESMMKFYGNLADKQVPVLKALNSSTIKINSEFAQFVNQELSVVKQQDFKLAVAALLENNNKALLTQFSKEWTLDQNIFDAHIQNMNDEQKHIFLLNIKSVKKTQEVAKSCYILLKSVKKANGLTLIEQIVEQPEDAIKLIDSFMQKFAIVDLRDCGSQQIMQLLNTNNEVLIHKLTTDGDIMIDWVAVIEGKRTLLSELAHMTDGHYVKDAVALYGHNSEDWKNKILHHYDGNHDVALLKVDDYFGDLAA